MDEQNKPTVKSPIVFSDLPGPIIDWLNSETVFAVFLALEKRFNITKQNVQVLPNVIGWLVTGELTPTQARDILQKDFAIPSSEAEMILLETKEQIINPISIPLRRLVGVDLTGLPGAMPSSDKSISMEPEKEISDEEGIISKPESKNLDPLIAGPKQATAQTRPTVPGMETPGLRVMKDVKAPIAPAPIEIKKPEAPRPAPITSKTVAAPRPFMLHEEKPLAPSEPAALRVNTNFSFDSGAAPVSRTIPRPVAAQFNSSSEAVLDQKKPATPVIAKTAEIPKVVHYTSMRTPLEGERPTNS